MNLLNRCDPRIMNRPRIPSQRGILGQPYRAATVMERYSRLPLQPHTHAAAISEATI